MTWSKGERLYDLLPAIHRIRDGETNEVLRALLSVIESELEIIEGDIEGLYENWFIETCDSWVIPYLGDLVANRPLHEIAQPLRADVAKTVSYRRRKTTVPLLAELAADVTGWQAHVAEFFQLLAWTQNANHVRWRWSPNPVPFDGMPPQRLNPDAVDRVGTVNFRHHDLLDRIDGPFDEIAHTVDVRSSSLIRDRYNISKVGIYLWRLQSYELEDVSPAPSENAMEDGTTFGFHFSPLGADAPLFNRAKSGGGCTTGSASEVHVSGRVRPLALHFDLERRRAETEIEIESNYVGDERAISITKDGNKIAPQNIVVMDLETWHRPPSEIAGVEVGLDPMRGRLVFGKGSEPNDMTNPNAFSVTYHYGFGGDLGGGPYRRELDAMIGDGAAPTWAKTISKRAGSVPADYDNLGAALGDWAALPADDRRKAVLTILDNGTYILAQTIQIASDEQLVMQADSGHRPTIQLNVGGAPGAQLNVELVAGDSGNGGTLILNGLLIEGGLQIRGPLRGLEVLHCTLVPGRSLSELGEPIAPDAASIAVEPGNTRLDIAIDHGIVGPLRLPEDVKSLTVGDSVIDGVTQINPTSPRSAISQDDGGAMPGPATSLRRVTIFGGVHVRELTLASEVIFTQPVKVARRQAGCVRFSFVPVRSITPQRYRCQPALEMERRGVKALPWMAPSFTSTRYSDPGYAQLRRVCPVQIRTGAEDGSEMGAYALLKQPQREANLRQRLDEYLPFGLKAAILFVT